MSLILPHHGRMSPAQPPVSFVGVSALTSTSGALPLPTGSAAGDFCFLSGVGNADISGSGFTVLAGDSIGSISSTRFAYKILTSGDIASPPTITPPSIGGYYCAIYRGPTSVAKKSATNSSTNPIVMSGFTKAADSKFVICTGHDRDPGAPYSAPSGFNFRATGNTSFFGHLLSDLPSGSYGGGSVSINLTNGSFAAVGTLLELT